MRRWFKRVQNRWRVRRLHNVFMYLMNQALREAIREMDEADRIYNTPAGHDARELAIDRINEYWKEYEAIG